MLLPGQTPSDRPLLVARVFKLKLKALITRLEAGLIFKRKSTTGTTVEKTTYLELKDENGQGYTIVVTEFQKRGLPHAHIAFRPASSPAKKKLPDGEKCPWVDHLICAQLPSAENKDDIMKRFGIADDAEYDRLVVIVSDKMLHDKKNRHKRANPNEKIWCHKDGKCEQFYPKPHDPNQECSYVDNKGYMQYKRLTEDDGWVVPYNPRILLDFECHCNVEIAGTVNVILYLYKYLYKGSDKAKMFLEDYKREHPDDKDELMHYRIARYISSCEAAIRLLEIPMYVTNPSVESLNIHLELEHDVKRQGASKVEIYLYRPPAPEFNDITIAGRQLRDGEAELGFFELYIETLNKPSEKFVRNRQQHDDTFEVHHVDITTHLGDGSQRTARRYIYRRQKHDVKITRLQAVDLSRGELWYLRLILFHATPRSFDEAKTVTNPDGTTTQHATYQAAARAMGLLQDMNEAIYCLHEAVENMEEGENLRLMFCVLLREGWPVSEVLTLTDITHTAYEDFSRIAAALESDYLEQCATPHLARNSLLEYIHDYISKNSTKRMRDFGLPEPENAKTELQMERLLYNDPQVRAKLHAKFEKQQETWTAEFHAALAMIMDVRKRGGGFCAIFGAGGTGKTYLTTGLADCMRSQGEIVRIAAPTGLAATLYDGGVTMHELFKLLITQEADDEHGSTVDKHPQRQELLRECGIILIDEAFNCHLANINAAIEALQQICVTAHETAGKVIVFIGDRFQIAPVVQDDSTEAGTVAASIVSMPNWKNIPKVHLTIPFRNKEDPELAAFVEKVATGAIEAHTTKDGVPLILLPAHLIAPHTDEDAALNWFMQSGADGQQTSFRNKAILSAINTRVDALNLKIQERRGRQTTTLNGSTKLKDGQEDGLNLGHSPEMLFDLRANNTPPHLLSLAEGDIVFLMRTLDKRKNLTNNTRLLILDIKTRFIKVQTLGDHPQTHLIPRIRFTFKMHRRKALMVDRLQFPLRLAYAMTFNRAQGQTLDKVLFDGTSRLLQKNDCHGAFTHGQCNVAISRVRRREDIAILVDEHNIVTDAKTGERCALTTNIVFKSFIS
jgi:hypothetical protein